MHYPGRVRVDKAAAGAQQFGDAAELTEEPCCRKPPSPPISVTGLSCYPMFWRLFDINTTSPHRFYKQKLGEAYLVQPDPAGSAEPLRDDVSLRLSDCSSHNRAPRHVSNLRPAA